MAEKVVYPTFPKGPGASGGSGGDGGDMSSAPTWKDVIDAGDERTRAQNDARFAEIRSSLNDVLSQVHVLNGKIDSQPRSPSIWQIAGVVGAGIGALVAIAAFAFDRFDGGIGAGAIVSNAVEQISAEQRLRDEAQDRRLDEILRAIKDDE
jgi:hypothetical protein